MFSAKSSMGRFMSIVAVTGCLVSGIAASSLAQNNPGLVIFSGVNEREDILDYYLDYGGRPNIHDRYRLRIPAKKMELGVAQFAISYPDYYEGKFDVDSVEVKAEGELVPVQEVVWDKENRLLQIYLSEPIEAGKKVELVLSNVKNPRFGGTFYFECRILTPGEVPLPRYLGTWIVSIGRN